MITFIVALLVLVGGYFLYGSYVERVFGPDKTKQTPALTMTDGVDFIPLPGWKIFMIQFLNIAGLGPQKILITLRRKSKVFTEMRKYMK